MDVRAKIRVTYLLPVLVLALSAGIVAGPSAESSSGAGFGEPLSVLTAKQEISEINRAYFRYLDLLAEFNQNKLEYFRRGLGWQNGAYYGFESGRYGLYFSKDQMGIKEYDKQGGMITALYLNLDKEVQYATLDSPGNYKMGLGLKNGSLHWLEWRFADGSALTVSKDLIRVSFADNAYYYMLYNNNDEPTLSLSPALSRFLFSGGDRRGGGSQTAADNSAPDRAKRILNLIDDDYPNLYFTRILKQALKSGIDIRDRDALAYFCVSWFRGSVGLGALPVNVLLKKAAQNHADYLIANGVVKKMLAWDVKKININDYLELHNEIAGKKLFTGQHVPDRTEYTGYGRNASETANLSRTDPLSSMIGWFHSIYHRRPFIDIRAIAFGYAQSINAEKPDGDDRGLIESADIANWGYDWRTKSERIYFYPARDEKLVPYAWAAYEAPDPFPGDAGSTGPPISASFTSEDYRGGSLTLFDEYGKQVPCLSTDVLPAGNNFIEITPADPLRPGGRYTVRFDYKGGSISYDFFTAPLNPAETEINGFVGELCRSFDLRDPEFDVRAAVALGKKKGALEVKGTGGQKTVFDEKYGFSVSVPDGWEVVMQRDWQEVLLKKSYYSINLFLYAKGREATPQSVMQNLGKNVEYKRLGTQTARSAELEGYRAEYSWKYDNKVIHYYCVFGDYALGIYGYGVTDFEMRQVFESFKSAE